MTGKSPIQAANGGYVARLSWNGHAVPNESKQPPKVFGDSHTNKCPRCDGAMVCYVSSPIGWRVTERRLYFSCKCGMIVAVNEEDGWIDPASGNEGRKSNCAGSTLDWVLSQQAKRKH